MLKTCLYTTILLSVQTIYGQNLVQNGDFEQHSNCPLTFSSPEVPTMPYSTGWISPHQEGTSDYYHVCNYDLWPAAHPVAVPENAMGFQPAKSGEAYAGLIAWCAIIPSYAEYREYIQTKLSTPLKEGEIYKFSMFVSHNGYHYALKYIGALFSSESHHKSSGYGRITAQPQIENKSAFLTDSLNWTEISGYLLAKGNEEYLTIGYFKDSADVRDTFNTTADPAPVPQVYYYVDDVSLELANVEVPNVFTPNNDHVNDVFELPFMVDSLYVLDRWGNLLFSGEQGETTLRWDGTNITGEAVKEGVYFYTFHLGNNQKAGFVHLLR